MDALYEELARPWVEWWAKGVQRAFAQVAPTQPRPAPAEPVSAEQAPKKKSRKNAGRGGYVRTRA